MMKVSGILVIYKGDLFTSTNPKKHAIKIGEI